MIRTPSTHDRTHPRGSMHRCLNIDEIVRLIACELVTSGRKATAVGLACCCKGFQDPVLDALWATQFDLFTLFMCFPEDVWFEGGYTVSAPTTYLLFFSQRPGSKVFRPTSDGDRMGSFPKLRSKNASAQEPWHSENPVFRGIFRRATSHSQRTFAPKSDNSRFGGNHGIVNFIHPLVVLPHNHLRLSQIPRI